MPDLRVKAAKDSVQAVSNIDSVNETIDTISSEANVEKPIPPFNEVVKPRGRIRLSPSINDVVDADISKQTSKIANNEGVTVDQRPVLTLQEEVERVRSDWEQVVTFWQLKGKIIIASALINFNITDDTVILLVANLSVRDEILAHKQEIEMSIKEVLNVRATIEVVVSDMPMATKPRTLEQILNFMVAKNRQVLKVKEAFNLTV